MKPEQAKLPSPNMLLAALKKVRVNHCAISQDYSNKTNALYDLEKKILRSSPEYRKANREVNAAYKRKKKL